MSAESGSSGAPALGQILEVRSADEATTLLGNGWIFLGLAPHTDHTPSIFLGWPRPSASGRSGGVA
jgi:hypothetical protein